MMTSYTSEIIGHETERRAIATLLQRDPPAAGALLLEGEVGIGKTTVLRCAVQHASARGYLVLQCQPAEIEAALPFAALGDLLEPVFEQAAAALPAAQRLALETALAIAAPTQPFAGLAVSRAVLALLRNLADRDLLAIAIDDAQWLDRATAAVLEYTIRRLTDAPVRFLVARRSERDSPPPLGLGRALGPDRLRSLRVGPLQLGELDLLLQSSLAVSLPRPRLVDLHRITRGNPFYALEIVRSMRERGTLLADTVAVPESLAELLRQRLAQLSPNADYIVLLASAAAQPTSELLQRAEAGIEGLSEAIRHAVLELDGQRLRFSHPLLASVAYSSAPPWRRRATHS